MKKIKKLSALIIAGILVFASSLGIAFADTKRGQLNGHDVIGHSSVTQTSGIAYTDMLWSGSVSVNATYAYVNINTLETATQTKSAGGQSNCSVSFSAPSSCRSVYISASHWASLSGQTWSASTYDAY